MHPNLATEIFTRVAHCEPLKLKALSLYAEDLSSVSPEVLTLAVSRLETVELPGCRLSPSQLKLLLNQVADGKCFKLKLLDLQMNDISQVPSDLLVVATQRLERVNFRGCKLTTEQLHSVFSDLAEGKCSKLKHLNLSDNNMSQIPSELLVAATQRLESIDFVDFQGSALTTEQVTALYQMVAERRFGSLRKLGISCYVDMDYTVPPSLIERAKLNKSVSIF